MTSQTSQTTGTVRKVCVAALLTFATAVAIGGEACGAHAAIAAASDAPSITVRYGDLNLATAEGNRVLLRRIVVAASKVCPAATAPGSRLARNRSCMEEAIARAVSDTQSAQLAEMQAARTTHNVRS
jgi:UrcA family protein